MNEELKKKIVEIINNELTNDKHENTIVLSEETINKIAEELVFAGLKFVIVPFMAKYDFTQQEHIYELKKQLADAEHRADVGEKALHMCATAYLCALGNIPHDGVSGSEMAADLRITQRFIRQAERELAND